MVISIKQLQVYFFMTISDFVYKGQTQFCCKSLGEILLTFIQLIQNIEAVKRACLDGHYKRVIYSVSYSNDSFIGLNYLLLGIETKTKCKTNNAAI